MTAIGSDRSRADLPTKVVRNRSADVTSGCWIDGQRTDDLERCERTYPHALEPRTVAGDTATISTLSCYLKPLRRDYRVVFTNAQWSALERAFPNGVCDFSKPGVGLRPTVTWLSYSAGPGGKSIKPTASP
jgi:hypothetical protein